MMMLRLLMMMKMSRMTTTTTIPPYVSSCPMSSSSPIEGDAAAGQPPGPAAHPPPHRDPPAEGGAGVPPPQGDAGQGHVRAGGVRRGVRPSLRHPHEGRLRPLHPAQAPGTDQDEHQLAALLAVLRFNTTTNTTIWPPLISILRGSSPL